MKNAEEKDFAEDQRIYDILDACGVKEKDQDRLWFTVHRIVDQGQNYWYNKARAEALEEAAKVVEERLGYKTANEIAEAIRALKGESV